MEKAYQLVFTSSNGGQIEIHPDHLTIELAENQFFALVLALNGKHVKLLPYTYEPKVKNPDAEVDGMIVDFKFPSKSKTPHTAIQAKIKEANLQGASTTVIYLGNPLIERRDIKRALIAAFQEGWNSNIEEVWLIYRNFDVLEINRKEIDDRSFIERLK